MGDSLECEDLYPACVGCGRPSVKFVLPSVDGAATPDADGDTRKFRGLNITPACRDVTR